MLKQFIKTVDPVTSERYQATVIGEDETEYDDIKITVDKDALPFAAIHIGAMDGQFHVKIFRVREDGRITEELMDFRILPL